MNPTGQCLVQNSLCTVIKLIIGYLNQFLYLLMAFAIVVFIWYIIKYFIKPDSEKKEAGNYVMYSLIGFFVILSVWGIVRILMNTFGLSNVGNSPSVNEVQNLFPHQ